MSEQTRPTLVVGSFNVEKTAEIAELLGGLGVPVCSLRDYSDLEEVPEDGDTFAANARIKALGLAAQLASENIYGLVADDSGIEVDAMDKRPGIYTARYLGEDATDIEQMQGILTELKDVPQEKRTARFRCAIAFVQNGEVIIETEGTVEGHIGYAPAGDFGFGYDPIFIPNGYDRTFAELGADVKHQISHRATALCKFYEKLVKIL